MDENIQTDLNHKTSIELKCVSKSFGARSVLKDIDLEIKKGQSVCLCGINGAGKTTLLAIMAGLLRPDKGSVHLCGYNLHKDPEKAKPQLGAILHKTMVYPDLTLLENLLFFANLYGVKDGRKRANTLLKDLGLFSYRYDQTSILSHGALQRLAIARALVHQPSLLLADEPFTGLDSEVCKYLTFVLSRFTEGGGTFVMTTHDVNTGICCCHRVLVLDDSHLIFDAGAADIDTAGFARDYLSYARNRN